MLWQDLAHFQTTCAIDLCDDIVWRVVDVRVVLEPRDRGTRDAGRVAFQGQLGTLGDVLRLKVLREVRRDNLLVRQFCDGVSLDI